jgi:hypothetical protein
MTEKHSSRYHCELGPSSSKRWMECPGSIAKCRGLPNKSTIFAEEGTAAHELASHCLESGFDAARYLGWHIDVKGETFRTRFVQMPKGVEPSPHMYEVTDEMAEVVQMYLDDCRAAAEGLDEAGGDMLIIEQRVVFSDKPEINGTVDFGVYLAKTRTAKIKDFKYGRGVGVDPEENSQALIYAIGLVKRLHNVGIERVEITIVQPRFDPMNPIKTWTIDAIDLLDYETDILLAAYRTEEPDAPLHAGDWCKFCPALATCEERERASLAIAMDQFGNMTEPTSLSGADLADRLAKVDELKGWCEAVVAHAHEEATQGRKIPGWKLVAKRAIRKWKDDADATDALELVLPRGQLFEAPKLKSPAEIEKLVPGSNKEKRAKFIEPLVERKSSGTVLAPESDKRPAVGIDAEHQFTDLSGGD